MQLIFGVANSVNDHVPYSGLSSFDAFQTVELFELDNRKTENCYTLWSDHIRNQYKNYWEVMNKYKLNDNWSGHRIQVVQDFFSELLGKEVEVQKLSVSICPRGYNVYTIVLCDK